MGAYIKENWLFVVVAVYLVSMVLYGHYRGFIRLAVSAVSLVLSLGVVHFGAPSVANLLRSNEVVYQAVEDSALHPLILSPAGFSSPPHHRHTCRRRRSRPDRESEAW